MYARKNIVKRERGVETERAEDCVVVHRVQMMSAKLLVFTPPLSALGPIWVFYYWAPLHGLYMVARMLQASLAEVVSNSRNKLHPTSRVRV